MFIRVEEFAGFWAEKKQEVTAGGYIRLLQHHTGVNSEQLSVAVNFRAFVREKPGSKLCFILSFYTRSFTFLHYYYYYYYYLWAGIAQSV